LTSKWYILDLFGWFLISDEINDFIHNHHVAVDDESPETIWFRSDCKKPEANTEQENVLICWENCLM
jgi:hypothetical protein